MLNSIGMICILLACSLFGYVKAQHYARRPDQIRLLIVALQRLESEIVYAQTPIAEVFMHMSKQMPVLFSEMFRSMADRLNDNQGLSLGEIWADALQQYWPHSSMKKQEFEIASQLGHVLGTSDFRDQIKHLRLAMSQLQAVEVESKQEQQKYESMWRSLGLLIGALIVILIY
jgi:stage III sporulation protein AB